MNKNKDQNLLQFPSALNVEPGGKAEVRPVENPDEPDWKREVARKVQEHQQRKKAKEGLENLKRLDELSGSGISEADRQSIHDRFASKAEPEDVLGLQSQLMAERFTARKPTPIPAFMPQGQQEEIVVEPPPVPAPNPPLPPPERDQITDKQLRDRLIESHQQIFRDPDFPGGEEPKVPPREPPKEPSFDRVALNRTPPAPVPVEFVPVDKVPEDEVTREDYSLSLNEILERRRHRKPAARPTSAVDRTILLSRLLSGLIDLVVVLGLSVGFLVMVSLFTTAPLLSVRMGMLLGGLFVMVFYIYGIFFLSTSGQTLGMLAVGVQLIQGHRQRMTPAGALVRISAYLLSIACGFLGLLWGVFDREARCWQDILSDSRVVRS
ncbi:MAG: RDD family protein [Acidobacteria bacterium]|nr:RDD family protein [Acidobacteriota bacterium]